MSLTAIDITKVGNVAVYFAALNHNCGCNNKLINWDAYQRHTQLILLLVFGEIFHRQI